MSILIDRPSIRARVHRVSLEHYHRMGELGLVNEKHELLEGYIIEKMSKSPAHERIKRKLLKAIERGVETVCDVRTESPLSIGDSEPEPDISVVIGAPDDWANSHPTTALFVAEVAVTSLDTDLEKAGIYATANIPEYWIVRADDCEIDVLRNPIDGRYTEKATFRGSEEIVSSLEGFSLVPAELFAIGK
jgi:Uma2 family endonuclease